MDLIVGSIALVTLAHRTPVVRPEHNAFLNRAVFSAGELVKQVKTDPVVRHRYEKHFMMSEPTLEHYFQKLHLEPLSDSKRYLVFNVDDSFTIRHRLLHLTKGTLVFADSNHKPILKRSCGNPMTAYLPALGTASKAVSSQGGAAMLTGKSSRDADGLLAMESNTGDTLAGQEPGAPTDSLLATDTAPVDGLATTSNTLPEELTESPQGGSTMGTVEGVGAAGAAMAGLLGAAGVFVAFTDHGGGSRQPSSPAPVPEPTTSVALLAGTVGLVLNRRRSRR